MTVGSTAMAVAILLAVLRVPLAFALLRISLIGLGVIINWKIALLLLPTTISEAVLSYDLADVPMFILMGAAISIIIAFATGQMQISQLRSVIIETAYTSIAFIAADALRLVILVLVPGLSLWLGSTL